MTVDRKLTFSLYVMKYTGSSGYIYWSTKICELSQAPLATEYVHASLESSRHEDAALKCSLQIIVMKCSAIPISQLVHIAISSYQVLIHSWVNWSDNLIFKLATPGIEPGMPASYSSALPTELTLLTR